MRTIAGTNLATACHDLGAGAVSAALTVAFSLSYAALMFAGPLVPTFPTGVAMALITSAVAAIVVALQGTFPFAISGADSATVAPMAAMLATVAAHFPPGLSMQAQT